MKEIRADRKSRYNPKLKVLELGAGNCPDVRTTHAFDQQTKRQVGTFKNIEYTYNHNLSIKKIPYPANYFDRIISYYALGVVFAAMYTYRESFRVLKPRGTIEIGMAYTNTIPKTIKNLIKAGFKRENIIVAMKTFPYDGDVYVVIGKK